MWSHCLPSPATYVYASVSQQAPLLPHPLPRSQHENTPPSPQEAEAKIGKGCWATPTLALTSTVQRKNRKPAQGTKRGPEKEGGEGKGSVQIRVTKAGGMLLA